MSYSPPPRRSYVGTMTDTNRWKTVDIRRGDVFVCTPPKCGTTWTISIVAMLVTGRTDVAPQRLVQWVDAKVVPLQETLDALAAQTHQRCLKTHTPFDGIPWVSDAAYIAVYRHPVDVLFSLRKHLRNTKDLEPDHPYFGSTDDSLLSFLAPPPDPDDFDFDCLPTLVHHYKTFAAQPRPKNLLMLHYADMLADPRGSIQRIATHIGVKAAPSLIDAIEKATAFKAMKSKAERFAPFSDVGYWHDPSAFFDSAGTAKWAGQLKPESLAAYREAIGELLSPEEITWLENGIDAA